MKFFIPFADNEAQAEDVYSRIKAGIEREGFDRITARRIYYLNFRHEGVSYEVKVGEPFKRSGATVLAILEGKDLYYICTPSPYMTGLEEVGRIEDFDPAPPEAPPQP